jgi:hypothetical protein
MTLTAMTTPLPVRAEIRVLCQQLLAPDEIVAGILMLAIITMMVVTVWATVRFLPDGLPPYYLAFGSTYDYSDDLEYCSSLNRHTLTWPFGLLLYGSSCR